MPYHLPEVKLLYSHFYIYGPHPSPKKSLAIYDLRFTIYDLESSASGARGAAKQMRAGCPKAVIGRGYKGAGIWGGPGRGMGNELNELGANFIGTRVGKRIRKCVCLCTMYDLRFTI